MKSLRETFATEPRLRDECIRLVLAATHHLVHCALMDNADFSSTGQQISLCETLDRVLNKGVVVAGEVVISVADIDLIYLNLQLLLASFETAIALQESARPNHQFHRVEGP